MVYTCIYIGKRINVILLIVRGHAKFMGLQRQFQVYFKYILAFSVFLCECTRRYRGKIPAANNRHNLSSKVD